MNRLPMRELYVNRQLDRVTSSLFSYDTSIDFREKIAELRQLQTKLKEQEQEIYKIFGVKDIDELNQKIKKYTGLARLGGARLRVELEGHFQKKKRNTNSSLNSLVQKIFSSSEFQSVISNHFGEADWTHLSSEIVNEIIQELRKGGKNFRVGTTAGKSSNKIVGLEKILLAAVKQGGKVATKNISKQNFSPDFLKRLDKMFDNAKVSVESSMSLKNRQAGEYNVNLEDPVDQYNRSQYDGWKRTIEELQADPSLESKIRDELSSLCLNIIGDSSEERNAFTNAFAATPTSSLLVSTIAGLQGIIGEIALGAYVELLTEGKSTAIQVGDVRNMLNSNGQIAIDVLLSNFGFQVKNYNEIDHLFQKTITLSRTNKLNYWIQKLAIDGALKEALDTFYGIRWYNIEYDSDYEETQNRILQIEKNLGDFYARYPDKILRLYEDIHGESIFNSVLLQGRFYNTFYFVSGQKFIPSSQIIEKIINCFSSFSSTNQDVKASSSYSGYDIRDFLKTGEYDEAPPIGNVVSNVSVTINWKLRLDEF